LQPFQEIVDTYGIPNYKEANPGVFTVVTFPFLFGVMFGDIGHGGLMFLVGLFLTLTHKPGRTGLLGAMAPARYIFLLLGLFALYCGLCYNDFMSIPLELFGKTCYSQEGTKVT
jgi:V-type H+-transporting ATPase subunit a